MENKNQSENASGEAAQDASPARKNFFRQFAGANPKQDILAGIIVALVSIPISIGYSQIAGLPPVYGLYGSLLPVLVYSLLTTSPRFVFGVDAAPAALVGSELAALGIASQSEEAMAVVPLITLLAAIWLFVFRLIGMGKFVKFISTPVMGGFITGVCFEIILMQIPKLFGGSAGQGELPELVKHLVDQAGEGVSILSLILGAATIAIIQIFRKIMPRLPMTVIMMFAGAALTAIFHLGDHGVKLLPEVASGLPGFVMPSFAAASGNMRSLIMSSLSIALVILAETLLATNDYAVKCNDKIDNNREILAYACGNLVSAFTGCCPVNGSVSRTGIANQFGVKSQLMSVAASVTMVFILLFGTGFISLLPVPVLTGIVISALIGSLEFELAHRLRKVDRTEFFIFYIVFFVVLFLGSVYGVLAGIILSFVTVILRAADPPRTRLGYIPEKDAFYPLDRMTGTREIEGVVIYRFSGSLFFANIGLFQDELDRSLSDGCRTIIIDASGITSIDVTAAERLLILYDRYKASGIRMYLTEHTADLNDQLRTFGARRMFYDGAILRTIPQALFAAGVRRPYPLCECRDGNSHVAVEGSLNRTRIAEFEWAFGEDAEKEMRRAADSIVTKMEKEQTVSLDMIENVEKHFFGGNWSMADKEKFFDMLELELASIQRHGKISPEAFARIQERISEYHAKLDQEAYTQGEDFLRSIVSKRVEREKFFREHYPELYKAFQDERRQHREVLHEKYPQLFDEIRRLREEKNARQ